MILDLLFTFVIAFAMLFLMRKVARNIGLVDIPSGRKAHTGNIPLVGGVAICITIVHYIYSHPGMINHENLFMLCITALTAIGVLDDKYDLSVKFRIIVQTAISIVMIYFAGAQMQSLGNMFGIGDVILSWLGPVITVFAVIGCINAFNMVDGIDGLLGGLSIVTFGSIAILLSWSGEQKQLFMHLTRCDNDPIYFNEFRLGWSQTQSVYGGCGQYDDRFYCYLVTDWSKSKPR
ncbi:MraY family glycosyltransferase [Pseudoalteromonas sp. Hal099]